MQQPLTAATFMYFVNINVLHLYSPLQQSISVYQSVLQQIINKEKNKEINKERKNNSKSNKIQQN